MNGMMIATYLPGSVEVEQLRGTVVELGALPGKYAQIEFCTGKTNEVARLTPFKLVSEMLTMKSCRNIPEMPYS